MFGLARKTEKARPIGLDIGHNSIKMIQLAEAGGDIRVVTADEIRFDYDASATEDSRKEVMVSSIKEMLSRSSFCGRDVVSCISNDNLSIKNLRLDTADTDRIEELMYSEAAERFDLDPDSNEIRYMVAGNVYQGDEIKNEVIIFATNKSIISEHISMLEEAGLNPTAIDTVPCALFRSFQRSLRRQEDEELVSVFVDVSGKSTTVVIGRGRKIVFVKQIPIAGDQINEEVALKLGVSVAEAIILRSKLSDTSSDIIDSSTRQTVIDAMSNVIEELAKEVSLCFKYYAVTFRGQRPQEAFFTGGESYEVTLLNALKRHLGVEIKIAQPLRGFDLSKSDMVSREHPTMCEWAVAVGLCIKGWDLPALGNGEHERN